MVNVLFSPTEIKKLKEHIKNQKSSSNQEHLDGFYKALSNIEKRNNATGSITEKTLK